MDAARRHRLFADAEVAENHIQDLLDIDPTGEAPERAGGDPQLLGQQILMAGHFAPLRPRRMCQENKLAKITFLGVFRKRY